MRVRTQPRCVYIIARASHVIRTMRTSKQILDSVSEHDTTKAQSRRHTGHPRHLHGPLTTLPSPPPTGTTALQWRACTDAHSRVSTLAIASDQPRRKGRYESQKLRHQQAASTHTCTGTRSQLHEVVQWVGPDAAQLLTPRSAHLRSPTAQSAHRGAPGAPSRPKSMGIARQDRVKDGLPTVEVAHVVELVGFRDGEVTPSRPS
jgi:hypothetical protein